MKLSSLLFAIIGLFVMGHAATDAKSNTPSPPSAIEDGSSPKEGSDYLASFEICMKLCKGDVDFCLHRCRWVASKSSTDRIADCHYSVCDLLTPRDEVELPTSSEDFRRPTFLTTKSTDEPVPEWKCVARRSKYYHCVKICQTMECKAACLSDLCSDPIAGVCHWPDCGGSDSKDAFLAKRATLITVPTVAPSTTACTGRGGDLTISRGPQPTPTGSRCYTCSRKLDACMLNCLSDPKCETECNCDACRDKYCHDECGYDNCIWPTLESDSSRKLFTCYRAYLKIHQCFQKVKR